MEDDEKVPVNLPLNDVKVPFKVPKSVEPFYRNAGDLFNERLAVLKKQYGTSTTTSVLVSVVAIEALVDALKADHHYTKLKIEVENRLREFSESHPPTT
ncbi:MAG: cell division protein ZapA [Spirosomataceae bacterium]